MDNHPIVKGFIVPGLPHPLLAPEQNEGWQSLRDGFEKLRLELEASDADLLLIYSTMWPSVIGHQIQAHPTPEWVHVDELFHDLGSIPYRFKIDSDFAHTFKNTAQQRGLHTRTVAYHGFPIDTGSVVALKLLNPDNRIPACIVSSNVYSDRSETVVLGKATVDALQAQGKKAAVAVVMTLSNRLFTEYIDPTQDRIHSLKDDEWNRKILEFLQDGRLEDVAQLSREIQKQIRVKKVVNFKPMWWLSAAMGQHNHFEGKVHAYAPIYGTGSAVVSLTPSQSGVGEKEYDEEDVDFFSGDRNVLTGSTQGASPPKPAVAEPPKDEPAPEPPPSAVDKSSSTKVMAAKAPKPVGAYPHARRVGNMLYLSGVGPRDAATNQVPGGPVRDQAGNPCEYDIQAQTRATIENVKAVLEASGSSLEQVIDVTAFLIDMDRDFQGYNEVYRQYFENIQAARTTLAIRALPTPIAVELKVTALVNEVRP